MVEKAKLAAVLAALAAAGCTQAVDHELRPGQYEISVSGPLAEQAVPGGSTFADSLPKTVCLRGEPKDFGEQLIAPLIKLHQDCDHPELTRAGARIKGSALCPLDAAKGPGSSVNILLSGEITATGLEADLGTRWNLAAGADPGLVDAANQLQASTLRLSARYVGVCESVSEPVKRKPSRSLPLRDDTVAEDTTAPDAFASDPAADPAGNEPSSEADDGLTVEVTEQ